MAEGSSRWPVSGCSPSDRGRGVVCRPACVRGTAGVNHSSKGLRRPQQFDDACSQFYMLRAWKAGLV